MTLTKKKIATTTVIAIETVIETGTRGAIETTTAKGTVTATEIGTATEGILVSYKLSFIALITSDNLCFVLSSQLEAGAAVVGIIGSPKAASAAIATCVLTFSLFFHTNPVSHRSRFLPLSIASSTLTFATLPLPFSFSLTPTFCLAQPAAPAALAVPWGLFTQPLARP